MCLSKTLFCKSLLNVLRLLLAPTTYVIHSRHVFRLLYLLVAVGLSGILKGKQKLDVTFNFDKQDVIDFKNFSKMTMCRASEANS